MTPRWVRAYRLLLTLYPPAYRRRYGDPMEEVFQRALESARQRGAAAVAKLALRTAWDLATNVPALWWRSLRSRGADETGRTGMRTRLDEVLADIRHALRGLRRNPGFAAVALLTLGVGIGAGSALFSILHPVLLAPLPFSDGDRVVLVENSPRPGTRFVGLSDPFFAVIADAEAPFRASASLSPATVNVGGEDRPERVQAMRVSGGFFQAVRVAPLLGRVLGPDDDAPGSDDAVVISEGLWTRRFARDPGVVGSTVLVDGRPRAVVGVLPDDFRFFADADAWMPLALDPAVLADPARAVNNNRVVVGLLEPGQSLRTAEVALQPVAARIRTRFPDAAGEEQGLRLVGYRDWLVSGIRQGLLLLAGAVLLVLMVACANLANLLLVRNEGRHQEMAVRAALGAGRLRLARQLATESLVLGTLGGLLGLGIGQLTLTLLRPLVPAELGLPAHIPLSPTVLAFTLALGLATGLLFGVAPALLRLRRRRGASGLRGSTARSGLRSGLVVAQVGVTALLLVGAGLMVRSLARLGNVDPGFQASGRWTMDLVLSRSGYPDDESVAAFARQLTSEAAALPGVGTAAMAQDLPLRSGSNWGFTVEGQPDAGVRIADYDLVGPGYFSTMGIPLLQGRDFRWEDVDGTAPVIVSASLAQELWPDENPLGRRINVNVDHTVWREVVGVAADVHNRSLAREPDAMMYFPPVDLPFADPLRLTLVLAAPAPPSIPAVHRLLSNLDGSIPPESLEPLSALVAASEARRRFLMGLLSTFAVITLVLAGVGLYGVVAYTVASRSRELGVRMALGAEPARVRAMVLRQGAVLAVGGLALGLPAALLASRFVSAFLYGVPATDPVTYAAVGAGLVAVALLATALPARRATRLDPARTLRTE